MHRLLELQAKRFLGENAPLPPGWDMFLAAMDDAYSSADAGRQRLEHSLKLISEELGVLRADLAERQLAEAQLEHLLSLLGATLESTADGIMALGKNGRLVRFNQRFIEMWRIPDDVTAFWEHERMMECIRTQLKQAAGDFIARMNYLCLHLEEESFNLLECLDGRLIECYSLPHTLGVDTVGRVFSFRDITERKQAEEALRREKEEQKVLIGRLEEAHNQLLQSEKMASIGQLAAGVAHEINNPIGYVNSNLGSLGQYVEKLIGIIEVYERAESDSTPSLREEIRSLKQEADWGYLKQDIRDLLRESTEGVVRVKQIVQDLKDFSHIDESEWLCADLHKGIDSTLNIVYSEIKQNAEVIKEYGAIPLVECMASQLNQVFMNMLVNASHAIGEGGDGRITIRTGVQNETVWIEIGDTGKGIAPEHINKIFDPFFTTKPVGKGTGLGLSLSFGIIKKHHGHIEVQSEVGKGTAFRIWLPVKRSVGEQ